MINQYLPLLTITITEMGEKKKGNEPWLACSTNPRRTSGSDVTKNDGESGLGLGKISCWRNEYRKKTVVGIYYLVGGWATPLTNISQLG